MMFAQLEVSSELVRTAESTQGDTDLDVQTIASTPQHAVSENLMLVNVECDGEVFALDNRGWNPPAVS
jgi:hypothetical protein